MQLYNTLTRSVEYVKPLHPPQTTVYTCGPTVYDYAHIGHWYNYVRMDTLIRTLQLSGLKPEWVMNITDVGHLVSDGDDGEDKLEKGARREGKTAWEIAAFYTQDFLECMRMLHILTPGHITKATEHIPEQIELIQRLEAKGYTYIISDGVYYDTSKFKDYAAFARLDLDGMQAGARVDYNHEKRNPTDFALWKFSPPGRRRDMEWESPWGKGFPGWHIECSAMSMKYLGEELDIHTGGIDHIPVHHTNEIAQSEAATGKQFAKYWMHSSHLMVNGEKISKSLGNGIRLQEIIAKGYSAETIRLHILESHYRSHAQFSWEGLDAATNRLRGYRAVAVLRYQPVPADDSGLGTDQLKYFQDRIGQALMSDLNTSQALAELSALADALDSSGISISSQDAYVRLLEWLDDALGLQLTPIGDISAEQKQLITQRQDARAHKDYAASDAIRDQLAGQGIGIKDTSAGSRWFYL